MFHAYISPRHNSNLFAMNIGTESHGALQQAFSLTTFFCIPMIDLPYSKAMQSTINFYEGMKMQNEKQTKLFAFKLAEKAQEAKPATQWQAREGVSVAGCTLAEGSEVARFSDYYWGIDNKVAC